MSDAPTKPIPEGYHTVNTMVTMRDTRRAIAFYERAFGAVRTFLMERPDGGVAHATIRIGDSTIMFGDESPDERCRSAESLGGSPIAFYLYVEDVDALFDRATGAGATVRMPLADMFWGDRIGTVEDPFGLTWTIATHVKDPTEDDLARGAEQMFAQSG
ncbi:MAG TPA: VOC family protein [Planctomycetota bacterium]|nr:VOC family protein [Planctomycetota bacterium]